MLNVSGKMTALAHGRGASLLLMLVDFLVTPALKVFLICISRWTSIMPQQIQSGLPKGGPE